MKLPTNLGFVSLLSATCLAQGPEWTLVPTTAGPSARAYHAMVYDSDRKVSVLFGGSSASQGTVGDTWEFDGKAWTEIKPALSPTPRAEHLMVYDSTRKVTVLYGGPGMRDTWTWDGATWVKIRIPAAQKPSARNASAMAFDQNRGRIVLFGGYDSTKGLVKDTWEFDGTQWNLMSSLTGVPPARRNHGMAYDPIRKRVVLFGGSNQTGYLDDVWEWNGTLWQPVTPATTSPPPRQGDNCMTFDANRRRIVLHGGWNGGRTRDTWEWDGKDWTQIMTATTPPARNSHTIVHEDHLGRSLIFSGSGANNDLWAYSGDSCYMTADVDSISITSGGAQTLTLDAGPNHANRSYWIFGSITGTAPGVSLNGVHIPLNIDVYTELAMVNVMANPPFNRFRAALDSNGGATAQFVVPANLLNVGFTLYHAYIVFDGTGMFHGASNPVSVTLK